MSLAVLGGAFGDILFSKGMKDGGEVHVHKLGDILPILKSIFTSPYVLFGIMSMAIYYGSYITALAWVDVSVATPITALSYVIATGYAVIFMRERVSRRRWAGVALITLGVIFVGMSS